MTIALLLFFALQQSAPQARAKPPAAQAPAPRPPSTTSAPAKPASGTQTPAPAGSTSATPRRTTPATATLEVRVVDRSGRPVTNAHVVADGPTARSETAETNGSVTLKALAPGNYRLRAEGEGFISLEREMAVKAGPTTQVLLSLSAAPPPPEPEPKKEPPPPPPAPAPVATVGAPGEPRSLSIPDLAEHSLSGKDALKVFPIGCSGLSQSRLIILRDSIPAGTNRDADETLYLVAGEATLTLGSTREQAISPGWFTLVPRGTSYALGRKGKNPAILLSTVNGRPCNGPSDAHQ